MNKKEEFKKFVSNHPSLLTIVRDKSHSWQDLYEVYDLYGDDTSSWNKYLDNIKSEKKNSDISNLSELTKLFKNVNIDNVQKYIDTAQKAIGVIQQLTGSTSSDTKASGPTTERPINKIFED